MKELVTYTENTEARMQFVKDGMVKLLDEEDIKLLPSYPLIRKTYQEYLDTDNITASGGKKSDVPAEIYGSLYLPPQVRNKNRKINAQIKRDISENASTEYLEDTMSKKEDSQKQKYATRNMPDFGENLLDDDLGPKPTKAVVEAEAEEEVKSEVSEELVVNADGTVYKVEIQGITYYLYGSYLYSSDKYIRVGSVTSDFEVDGKHYPIDEKIELSRLEPEYDYYEGDKKAFITLNDKTALCVGEINDDGNVCLFV